MVNNSEVAHSDLTWILSPSDTHNEYYKDKKRFIEAIKRKIIGLTISTETKMSIIKLITTKKQKDLRWEVEWTYTERKQFLNKIEEIEAKKITKESKEQELSVVLDDEITRERIQSFIISTKTYKRNKDVTLSNEKQNLLIENIIVYENHTVWEAMEKINQSEHNFVILVDKDWKFKWIYAKHDIDWKKEKSFEKSLIRSRIYIDCRI